MWRLKSLSATKIALIDAASRTKALLDHADSFIMAERSVINRKRKAFIPLVAQRQSLADSLCRTLVLLGLDRIAPVKSWLNTSQSATAGRESRVNIIKRWTIASLFAPWFKKRWLRSDTWATWRVFLKALYALPMDGAELEIYCDTPVAQGRRLNHSKSLADLRQTFRQVSHRRAHRNVQLCRSVNTPTLQRGEYGVQPIIASDKKQADVIFSYIANFFHDIPLLAKMLLNETKDTLELNNSIHVEVNRAIQVNARLR